MKEIANRHCDTLLLARPPAPAERDVEQPHSACSSSVRTLQADVLPHRISGSGIDAGTGIMSKRAASAARSF